MKKQTPPEIECTALGEELQDLLTRVANEMAAKHKVIKRKRKLSGAALAQILVFGYLGHPNARLTELAQTSGMLGEGVSPQAIAQRLESSELGEMIKALLLEAAKRVVGLEFELPEGLIEFGDIELSDGTVINLPAALKETYSGCGTEESCNQAGIKLITTLSLRTGSLEFELTNASCHDRTGKRAYRQAVTPDSAEQVPSKGILRLRDQGFFKLQALLEEDQAGDYWITRVPNSTSILDLAGTPIADLGTWLETQTNVSGHVDTQILLGAQHQIPCRLVATRVPHEVYLQRLEQARQQARKRQKPKDYFVTSALEWNIRVTNICATLLTASDIFIVYCLRWQIELLFKLLKSYNLVDESRSANPQHCLTQILAKLLGALIQHWCLVATAWQDLDRSMVQVARVVRRLVPLLIGVFRGDLSFNYFFSILTLGLQTGCKLNSRRKKPSSAQRLRAVGGLT